MSLDAVRPRERNRVMDLVEAAGVDVSDWKNGQGGVAKASTNPKYCFEWAFVEPGKLVVLNVWFEKMQQQGGEIFQELNLRRDSLETRNSAWAKRARSFDLAVQKAWREKLPLRVIVCDGKMREGTGPDVEASRVQNRLLDPEPWSVTAYDWMSGACRLSRGVLLATAPHVGAGEQPVSPVEENAIQPDAPLPYVDQFSAREEAGVVGKHKVESEVFDRNPKVRRRVLKRAGGRCEHCKVEGFRTAAGDIYLETHHVVPLSEQGLDEVNNVVAICANDHREAHFGEHRDDLRVELLAYLASIGD